MPNPVFDLAVRELERHLGDILAEGMTKMALKKVGTHPDAVTIEEMDRALESHVRPNLGSFMAPERSRMVIRSIRKRIREVA